MSQVSHQDIMDALCYAQKKYWQYTNADVGSTKNLEKEINDMDERRLMNGMKKDMTVAKADAKRKLNAQYGVASTYKPKKVIYDETAGVTVVLWMDGTKTIVRAAEGEEHDAYLGYCIALAKKMHGTNSALKRDLEKVLVVKEDKKLNISMPSPPSIKELADKVTEVMQKLNDATTKGE